LAAGFIVLLLATELVLTLPDVADSASSVASFYAAHRSFIVSLQALGLVAAGLFGAYAWRLRSVDRVVAAAGLLAAVCALVPGLITAVIAVVADPVNPSVAARWNSFEPRGDDVLCRDSPLRHGGRSSTWAKNPRAWRSCDVVALSCLIRLVVEASGQRRGALESVGPLSFIMLVAVMAVLSLRGVLSSA